MKVSVELTLTPLQNDFEPSIIHFIKKLRASGLTVLENPLSTQVYGEYDVVMNLLTREIKEAFELVDRGLLYMKIVKSDPDMIMSHIFDWIFDQYQGQPTHLVVLELIGVLFGFLSVWYAKKNNIWVYPTGIISTAVFVYILWHYGLLGDMIINAYYFSMSIYGWYIWTRKVDATHYTPITKTSSGEWKWSWILLSQLNFYLRSV